MRKHVNGANRLFIGLLVVVFGCTSAIVNANTLSTPSKVVASSNVVDYSNLKITEINYHPLDSINGLDTVKGKSYEFLEFRNTSMTESIDLTGVVVDSAVYYEFPVNFILAPQAYFVIADKPTWFMARYGYEASGNFEKNLSNSGEQIVVVTTGGQVIIDFEYSDDLPWPTEPDGDGNTLVSVDHNPTGDPGDYTYWKSSKQIHGNPFGNDDDYVMSAEDIEPDNQISVYPNPTQNEINIEIEDYTRGNSVVSVFNSIGVKVFDKNINEESTISFSNLDLPYGVYFVVVEYGNEVKHVKVVYSN